MSTPTQQDKPIILNGGYVEFGAERMLQIEMSAWQFDKSTKEKRAAEFTAADELIEHLRACVPARLLDEIRALDEAQRADEQAARFALDELEQAGEHPPQTTAKIIAWRARERVLGDTIAAHQTAAAQTQARLDALIEQAVNLLSDARVQMYAADQARLAEIKAEAERQAAPIRERLHMNSRIADALDRHPAKVITSPANQWLG